MASKVAEILSEMARNAGDAALRRGALIGNAVNQVGQIPAQYYAEQDRKRFEDLHVAQVQQQMGLEAARGARETQLAKHQDAADAQATKDRADWGQIISGSYNRDGTIDYGKGFDIATKLGRGDLLQELKVHQIVNQQKPTILKVGEQGFDPTTHAPIPGMGVPEKPNILKPGEQGFDATTNAPIPGLSVPDRPRAPTAEEDKAKYIGLQARVAQNLPVLPAEKAWMDAYEKEKGLNIDKSAAAATERATTAVAAQTAQQKRAQDFETLKTARADIQKNADTPFQSAQSAADELRSMVYAAQAGNKVAASEQALTTAAATIRGFGLNRINMAEIGMPASAGSAVDRVTNFIGKWKEGEPVNPDLQNDMLGVADLLEKAARKKYEATHAGINKLYGTTIPQTFAAEPAVPAVPATSGLTYADYLASKNKKK